MTSNGQSGGSNKGTVFKSNDSGKQGVRLNPTTPPPLRSAPGLCVMTVKDEFYLSYVDYMYSGMKRGPNDRGDPILYYERDGAE